MCHTESLVEPDGGWMGGTPFSGRENVILF